MEAPFSQQFIAGFVLVVLAIPLSMAGMIIFALPMGLLGGYWISKEMLDKYQK